MTVEIGPLAGNYLRSDMDIVNYIIGQRDAGVEYEAIAERLNEQGHTTITGKEWTKDNVKVRYHYWKPADR